eukprot:COSAG02_NODE_756_length_17532_cov_5.673550_9_plen_81_part_00
MRRPTIVVHSRLLNSAWGVALESVAVGVHWTRTISAGCRRSRSFWAVTTEAIAPEQILRWNFLLACRGSPIVPSSTLYFH